MFSLTTILITAIFIELVTLTVRFSFKIRAKDFYIKIMKKYNLKKFYHFHHLFLGITIALIFYFYEQAFLFSLGIGIAASDIIHHFVFLWLIAGNPEFHVVYKNIKEFRNEGIMERKKIRSFVKHLVHHA
jgi:hypothetical protein